MKVKTEVADDEVKENGTSTLATIDEDSGDAEQPAPDPTETDNSATAENAADSNEEALD